MKLDLLSNPAGRLASRVPINFNPNHITKRSTTQCPLDRFAGTICVDSTKQHNQPMNILQLHDTTVYRGPKKVFDGFSLEIAKGQNTAIVGPNGAGKSTLMKVLAKELYPAKGTVKVFEQERWNVWELRKRLGLVSADLQQSYAPISTGFDVVLSGFYSSVDVFGHQVFSEEQIEAAEKTIGELGIADLKAKQFSKMSTGEQRRHLLGRALVNQPEALVLDEPTSGLDLPATFQYIETVRQLMQHGKTLILVTHHLHEIPPEVEWVVFLKSGRVEAEGTKAQLLTDERLSNLFDVKLKVAVNDGYYHVYPAVICNDD